jgi:hypothetical protein
MAKRPGRNFYVSGKFLKLSVKFSCLPLKFKLEEVPISR